MGRTHGEHRWQRALSSHSRPSPARTPPKLQVTPSEPSLQSCLLSFRIPKPGPHSAPCPEKIGNHARVTQQDPSMQRLELGPCSAETPAPSLPPQSGSGRAKEVPGLGGSRRREGGRQAGSWRWWEEPFFPLSLANSGPRFQAALQSPQLLRHCTQSARGGRKGRLPPSGRGWGAGGWWGARQRVRGEDSEGSLTAPRGKPSWVHPWNHRGLSWESLGDLTPSAPQIDGDHEAQRGAGIQSVTHSSKLAHHSNSKPLSPSNCKAKASWTHLCHRGLICHCRKKNV